jgi:hypothetical protein
MSQIIFQPKGASTSHQEGSVIVQAPRATGYWGSSNYAYTGYPISVDGVDTGVVNAKYSGRFDDTTYYTT